MTEIEDDGRPQVEPGETLLTLDEAVARAVAMHQKGYVRQAADVYKRVLEKQSDHPDALHFLGIAATQLRDFKGAEQLIRAVLHMDPKHADAHTNLGNVLKMQGRLEEAQVAYQHALALAPDHPNALSNLGTLFSAAKQYGEAVTLYKKVLELVPDHVEAHHNLGNAYMELGDDDAALDCYQRAVTLKSYDPSTYRKLGIVYSVLNRPDDALAMYERWLELCPGDPEAAHMIAALRGDDVPARGSDGYVKQLFDRFAASFDQVLAGLGYQAPAIVAQVLTELLGEPRGNLEALDAGCGTGLGGAALKPYSRRLVGVDLSDGMITVARERGVYDEFVVSELGAYMASHPEAYDVVTAIDTFCYIGDLRPTAEALRRTLKEGGRAVFTLERCSPAEAPSGYRLNPHGRYSHSLEYIQELCVACGLDLVLARQEVLRSEKRKPVDGLAIVVQRPATA